MYISTLKLQQISLITKFIDSYNSSNSRLLLTIKSLLYYFFAVDNIYTLRQVFYFTAELHAAERLDAFLGSGVDCWLIDAGRVSCDYNLALYFFSIEHYSVR